MRSDLRQGLCMNREGLGEHKIGSEARATHRHGIEVTLLSWGELDYQMMWWDKSTIKRRPWRSFDYDAFAVDLKESELILDPPTDVNEFIACYYETLIRLLDKHAPLRKLKVKARPSAPWFDAECRDSKIKTRKLEKAYQHHPTTESKTAWKAQFIKQKVLYQQKFVGHWSTAISSCQSDSKVLWSKLRPLLQPESGSTSQLTADEFAQFFPIKLNGSVRRPTGD